MKKILAAAVLLFFAVPVAAADLEIPPDQPICKLYGMLRVFGTIVGVLVMTYAGIIS